MLEPYRMCVYTFAHFALQLWRRMGLGLGIAYGRDIFSVCFVFHVYRLSKYAFSRITVDIGQ